MLLESLPYAAMVRQTYCLMVNILLFILLWLFCMLPQTLSQFVFLPGHVFWYPSWNRQMFLMDKNLNVCSIHWLVLISLNTEKLFISQERGSNPEHKVLRKVSRTRDKTPIFIFFCVKEWLVKNIFCISWFFAIVFWGAKVAYFHTKISDFENAAVSSWNWSVNCVAVARKISKYFQIKRSKVVQSDNICNAWPCVPSRWRACLGCLWSLVFLLCLLKSLDRFHNYPMIHLLHLLRV